MPMQDVETTSAETAEKPKRSSRKSRARKSSSGAGGRSRRRSASSRSSNRTESNRQSATGGQRQNRSMINRAYSFAEEARRAVPRMTKDLRLPRRSDFDALTDANPLVIGAIGLGLGVVLGTLMPQRISGRLSDLAQLGNSKRSSSRRGRRS